VNGVHGGRHTARAAVLAVLVAVVSTTATQVIGGVAPLVSSSSPYGRRISAVQFQPGWLRSDEVKLEVGEILSEPTLTAALQALRADISGRGERFIDATGKAGFAITYVEPAFVLGPNQDVIVILRPFHLSLPTSDFGKLMLPLARGLPGGRGKAGSAALPLNLGVTSDRTIGLGMVGHWKSHLGGDETTSAAGPVSLDLSGQQSLNSSYHTGQASVQAERAVGAGRIRELRGAADVSSTEEPKGTARYQAQTFGGRIGLTLAPLRGTRFFVDAGLRKVKERYERAAGGVVEDSPDETAIRLMAEGIPGLGLGFFRAAVWQATQRSHSVATHQVVGRFAYSKEWLIVPNQGVGLEVVAGLGQTWGPAAERRRFYGGTSRGDFLYDAASSGSVLNLPGGPLLRSFGHGQAALPGIGGSRGGGTRFSHLNINISLPIPRWSRALIPAEPTGIPGPGGTERTLKDLLRSQVDQSGPNLLATSLEELEKLDPAAARKRAAEVFAEIQPAAHFIIDSANLFAVKPLLLFDAATLESVTQSASWSAAGVGVQLVVVTAKLDLGYMRTISGPTVDSRHNIFLRLGFERLF